MRLPRHRLVRGWKGRPPFIPAARVPAAMAARAPAGRHRLLAATLSLAGCALGASMLSAPAALATPLAGRPAAPAGPAATAQGIADRQQPLLAVADEILRLTGQGKAAGYAGYGDVTISVPARLVTLYWHGSVPSALRLRLSRLRATAPIRVVTSPYTWQQLESETRQLAAREDSLAADGYRLARVGPEPAATGLTVGVDYARSRAIARAAPASAKAASVMAALRRLAPGTIPMRISDTPLAQATGTRNFDSTPFWGGSRIVRPGNIVCSSGFSVISGSTHEMVTAGHCGGISTPWQTGDFYGSGNVMGTETARDPCCDTAIIKVGANQGHIYDKGWNSTAGEAVAGPKPDVIGTLICTEGATSGVLCGIDTTSTGQTVTFTNDDGSTFTSANEDLGVQQTPGQQADAAGDSGGPAIINTSTAGRVYATGTISGGDEPVTCSRNDDPSVAKKCYDEVWFEEINPILSRWNAKLVTG
jgi:hypothetical protein